MSGVIAWTLGIAGGWLVVAFLFGSAIGQAIKFAGGQEVRP